MLIEYIILSRESQWFALTRKKDYIFIHADVEKSFKYRPDLAPPCELLPHATAPDNPAFS
jgi:hypothetical protein